MADTEFARCKGGNGRRCSQDATDYCQMCGADICSDHIGPEQDDDPTAIICTDCAKETHKK